MHRLVEGRFSYSYTYKGQLKGERVEGSIGTIAEGMHGALPEGFKVVLATQKDKEYPLGAVGKAEDNTYTAITLKHYCYYGFANPDYACQFLESIAREIEALPELEIDIGF